VQSDHCLEMSPGDTANEKAHANISLHAIEAHKRNEPIQSTRNLQERPFRSCKGVSWNSKLKIEMSTVMLSKCKCHSLTITPLSHACLRPTHQLLCSTEMMTHWHESCTLKPAQNDHGRHATHLLAIDAHARTHTRTFFFFFPASGQPILKEKGILSRKQVIPKVVSGVQRAEHH
jgi:hypothetical protein